MDGVVKGYQSGEGVYSVGGRDMSHLPVHSLLSPLVHCD